MALNTNGISFSGLASGIDTASLIQKLVSLESQPITQMEGQQKTFQSKLSALGTFKGLVKDLQTKAKALSTKDSFASYFTSVSTNGHLSVSASGSASPGTHTVTVNQLATVDRWTFDGVTDKTVDLASADGQHVAFSVNGTNYDVVLTAGHSSLEEIAGAINSAAGEDVGASVVNAGTDANPNFQLVLTSKTSGEDNRITGIVSDVAGLTIDGTGPDGSGNAQSTNNITVGLNAVAVIDGLTVTRDTNEFNEVIAGVSITAQTADPSLQLSVSVTADTGAIKTKINDFVTAYNNLIDYVNTQNHYTKDQGAGGLLFGDPILNQVLKQVRTALFNVPPTVVQNDTAGYSTLSLVGIKTQSDGKLLVDATVLDDKISANLDKFADLFVDSDGFNNGGALPNTNGYYTDTTADSGLAATLDRTIQRMFDTYTGPGNKTFKGIFDTRTQTYNDSISKLFKDIAAKQTQVDKFQESLTLKFANLEQLMSGLQSQGASLAAGVSGFSNGG
ncbi:MAG: flagellar filament capping protein FliD [Planctomycetes bacterium]|nr:flagellar filament capping protein FliD [Planctomycetota bacterium]